MAQLQLRGNELLATGKMTKEEQEKYWEEQNQMQMEGNVKEMTRAAAGEEVTTEEVTTEDATAEDVPTEEVTTEDVATEEVVE